MLSAFDDDAAVEQSILAGASGFVLKQIKLGHIVDAVRLVARGEVLFDQSRQARVLERVEDGPDGHARRIGRLAWPT
jgi:two-component system, NarL family, response regulator DevR